ncbi:MAG TPA: TonB family protein [Rheinheimera sp.]|nr:TonB family protein [Rheinheimera sp.]
MRNWILLALFSCATVQADMLDALKAYEQKNYAEAQQQFAALLPLGNELAAFNLAAMAYQGEGQQQDLVKAVAHFMLAAELQHPQAKDLLGKISANASEQQLDQATLQYEQLKRRLVITEPPEETSEDLNLPQPVKRVPPEYPKTAVVNGLFGYVKLRFLVNEQGEVTAVDTLDAYPENTFEKASVRAIKRWRYEPSEQKHLLHVRLDYSMNGGVKQSAVERVMEKHKLWDYAVAGAPQYQFILGTLLSVIDVQSTNNFRYDPELPLAATPDFSIYKNRARLKADFDGFQGSAVVRVAKDGTITEQISARVEDKSEITNLVGLTLQGKVETEVYHIERVSVNGVSKVVATPSIQTSRAMSGMFWWEQAAKNGNLDAQRVMAAYDDQWEAYLLSQQDAEVMAWTGTRMILDGQREQGLALLEQAIAQNYQPAAEMKKQFM